MMRPLPRVVGPTDLPDLRQWLVSQYRPGGPLRILDGRWIESVVGGAAMWWVEPEACDVLAASSPSWPADQPLTLTDAVTPSGLAAFVCRDLLDELAHDDDVPEYRRNEARQAVADFDVATHAAMDDWLAANR